MAEFYGYVPTAAAQEVAYSIVESTAGSTGDVQQQRVLDRMAERGYDGEATRRALQQLLADDAIRIEDDTVRLDGDARK
jgi:hypothetical protein